MLPSGNLKPPEVDSTVPFTVSFWLGVAVPIPILPVADSLITELPITFALVNLGSALGVPFIGCCHVPFPTPSEVKREPGTGLIGNLNPVIWIIPATSNLAPGVVVPMPMLMPVSLIIELPIAFTPVNLVRKFIVPVNAGFHVPTPVASEVST